MKCAFCKSQITSHRYVSIEHNTETLKLHPLCENFSKGLDLKTYQITSEQRGERVCNACYFPAVTEHPVARIALIGQRGVGKSTWLANCLENLTTASFIENATPKFTVSIDPLANRIVPMRSDFAFLSRVGVNNDLGHGQLTYDRDLPATDPTSLTKAPFIFDLKLNLTNEEPASFWGRFKDTFYEVPNTVTVSLFDQAGESLERAFAQGTLISNDALPDVDCYICMVDGGKLAEVLSSSQPSIRQFNHIFEMPLLLNQWGKKVAIVISKSDLLFNAVPANYRSCFMSTEIKISDSDNLKKLFEQFQFCLPKKISITALSSTGGAIPGTESQIAYKLFAPLAFGIEIGAGIPLKRLIGVSL